MTKLEYFLYPWKMGLLFASFIAIPATVAIAFIHFLLFAFAAEPFQMFFGITVGGFVWWHYAILYFGQVFIYTLFIKGNFELL